MNDQTLEQRVSALEKQIAELKMKVSVRLEDTGLLIIYLSQDLNITDITQELTKSLLSGLKKAKHFCSG